MVSRIFPRKLQTAKVSPAGKSQSDFKRTLFRCYTKFAQEKTFKIAK